MEAKIYEYNIPIQPNFSIAMPTGARIIAVQNQQGTGVIYTIADPSAIPVERAFELVASNAEFKLLGKKYIGTFSVTNSSWTYHLFEIISNRLFEIIE